MTNLLVGGWGRHAPSICNQLRLDDIMPTWNSGISVLLLLRVACLYHQDWVASQAIAVCQKWNRLFLAKQNESMTLFPVVNLLQTRVCQHPDRLLTCNFNSESGDRVLLVYPRLFISAAGKNEIYLEFHHQLPGSKSRNGSTSVCHRDLPLSINRSSAIALSGRSGWCQQTQHPLCWATSVWYWQFRLWQSASDRKWVDRIFG